MAYFEQQPTRNWHNNHNIVDPHLTDVDRVDAENFVADVQYTISGDFGGFGDSGDKNPVGTVDAIPFANIKAQRLAGPFDQFDDLNDEQFGRSI